MPFSEGFNLVAFATPLDTEALRNRLRKGRVVSTLQPPPNRARSQKAVAWGQCRGAGGGRAVLGLGPRLHPPPLEGKGHTADVGTGTEVSDFGQVVVKVIDKGTREAQGFQQLTDLLFQAAGTLHLGPKRLGDAQVPAHHNHLQLSDTRLGWAAAKNKGPVPPLGQGKPSCLWVDWTRNSKHTRHFLQACAHTDITSQSRQMQLPSASATSGPYMILNSKTKILPGPGLALPTFLVPPLLCSFCNRSLMYAMISDTSLLEAPIPRALPVDVCPFFVSQLQHLFLKGASATVPTYSQGL